MTAPDPRVGEIQARLDAATPGPWHWRNTAKPMLMGARTRLVMAFSRMGMDSAQPEFRDGDGLMVKAGKANLNTFPDAEFIAAAPADIAYLLAELRKATRAAQTLGQVIEKQCLDVLNVTGLHHLINADGDGHWDVVWMRLFEMREELASLKESTIGRERLRGDKWRDRAQEMELSRDAAAAELRDRDEVIAKLSDWAGRYKSAYYDEAQDDVVQIIRPVLRAAVAAANGGGE